MFSSDLVEIQLDYRIASFSLLKLMGSKLSEIAYSEKDLSSDSVSVRFQNGGLGNQSEIYAEGNI